MKEYNFIVEKDDSGIRLDIFLTSEIEDVTRSRVKGLIDKAQCSVNGYIVTKSGQFLKENDAVKLIIADDVELSAEAQDIPLNIVYQDDDIAVINKDKGIVTHPSLGTKNGTLVNAIKFHIKNLSSINGVIRPGIVHRLDKDTSGLIVIAKNNKAHLSLCQQISEKTAKRFYVALVDGNFKEPVGIIERPIDRNLKERKKMAVIEGGRYAKTKYKVLKSYKNYDLTEFELYTGRTHQIRVHAAFKNHAVVGDEVYGGSTRFNTHGQMLHAYKLIIEHPATGESMSFEAPLPQYFEDVLTKIEKSLLKIENIRQND